VDRGESGLSPIQAQGNVMVVQAQPMYCFGSVLFQNASKSGGLASENPDEEEKKKEKD
jgi:hypothetical protein